MGWKTIHLSRPCKITVKNENLVLIFKDNETKVKVTLRDIDFILFDNTQFSITGKSLELIAKNGIATLFIDEYFHPCSILTPFHQHSTMSEVANAQLSLPQNFKEIIWQKIVVSKIQNQADVLKFLKIKHYADLSIIANRVQINDKNRDEAQAARVYWKKLFNTYAFRRKRGDKDLVNIMLNYSYSIVRACVARSVSASGLLPVFGLWHKNRYNSFALVDDLIEPFRPVCDLYIKQLLNSKYSDVKILNIDIKRDLVNILTLECIKINGGKSNMSSAVELFIRQYKKCMMSGEVDKLFFPKIDLKYFKNEFT